MVGANPSGFVVVDSINNLDAESYATSNVLSAQRDRCNAMVLTWIMNVVSQDVYKNQFNNNGNNITRGVLRFDKTSSTSLSPGFTSKQIQKILNLINDKPSGSIHANMAGRASFFNGNVCNVVDISNLKITVGHPNSTLDVISHVRNLKLANNVIMYVVLVVSGYCVSLLYVNKLIRDSKMFVGFDENKCQCNMVMTFHVSKVVWHNTLGHPADQVFLSPQSPNDDGRDPSNVEGSLPHTDLHDSTQGRNHGDRLTATQTDDQNWSEGNTQNFSQSSPTQNVEPTCLSEALPHPNWGEAMNNEIEALNRNNTWTICDFPIGRKPIGSKWLWKIKYKAFGDIERYKARLVAKSFSQREGFDYDETFSHVIKMVTVRCLIALVVVNNWPLYQLDVNNAFLYGNLLEDVYMALHEGYNNESNTKVCKLNKSLYGLKQTLRQWNAKLTTALVEHGFEQSKFDYSLYTKHNGENFISLLVYVDDIIITQNDNIGISEFKVFLSTKFMIKDLGVSIYFLGIEVVENDLGLCMSQRKYCLELLHEYGLLAARPVDILLPKNSILRFEGTSDDKYLDDFTSYQNLVGKLIYLTNTRPDISYVVPCLSQHIKAALRVLRDLKVSWKSKKQATISKSSSEEVEYRSMSTDSSEIFWLGNLLHGLGLKDIYPVELFCDNSSAIQIAANPVFHWRTKHFELDVYFVKEKVLAGIIKTIKISFELQTADVFTKCLGVMQHRFCYKNLGMLDVFVGDLVCKDLGRKDVVRKRKKGSSSSA
ncbi:ribonuclease H-like domain-containing protein [Tanacetum coccineum]